MPCLQGLPLVLFQLCPIELDLRGYRFARVFEPMALGTLRDGDGSVAITCCLNGIAKRIATILESSIQRARLGLILGAFCHVDV